MVKLSAVAAIAALLSLSGFAQANVFDLGPGLVNLEMVTVGNPNNAADTRVLSGGTSGYGAVAYTYNIGKYEVTTAQYTDFLNHKAKSDPLGLWNPGMADVSVRSQGCNIQRSGSSGSYAYTVGNGSSYDVSSWANRPVNYVSFWDACRFVNWLSNGQGNGDTETGAYTLTVHGMTYNTVTRNTGWKWALPSQDEWYKAAYYDPDRAGEGGYWRYSTRTDADPSNIGSDGYTDPGNHANFTGFILPGYYVYTIGRPYFRTNVGEFEASASTYGTFDQGGNVQEWSDTITSQTDRGVYGGSYGDTIFSVQASDSFVGFYTTTGSESAYNGFRIVESVPEPSSILVLAGGMMLLIKIGRRRT